MRTLFATLGYEIRKTPVGPNTDHLFHLWSYNKPDGSFDYSEYKKTQIAGNKKKQNNSWALEENILFLAKYISTTIGKPDFGICHGTRRGKEQEWFERSLDCEVIGTEISDTAKNFPRTIEWDFHKTKPEWLDAADFIYSNSFDHSYDPEKCLNNWMACVKKGGLCTIEHSSSHEKSTRLDPFGVKIYHLPYLILDWGRGQYCVREILDAPLSNQVQGYTCFIIIQKL